MEEPQEVQDEEYERVWERVAAVDVAKASGVVCTRVPDEARPGWRRTKVWTVAATVNAVTELADHLRCHQIEVVTLESTSVIRGRQRASATGGDGPLCSFLLLSRTVAWGPSATQTADRGADPATTSRRCRFCPFLADASATARPGPCPISSHLRPG